MVEMFCICFIQTMTTSHVWLLSTLHVAVVIEGPKLFLTGEKNNMCVQENDNMMHRSQMRLKEMTESSTFYTF